MTRPRPTRVAAVLVVGLATLSFTAAQPPAGKRYAVLVGIKHYDHAKLRDLDYAEDDVTDLAGLLTAQGYEVTLLTAAEGRRDARQQPTLANINARLKTVLDRCTKRDTLLIALSGHGLQFEERPTNDAFFCPQDARPLVDRTDTLLSLGKLYRELDDSGAGVKLLLVDACRDDPRSKGAKGAGGVDANAAPRPPRGVAALFSCSAGEQSFESDKLKHGVFFYYVLQGLKGEARNKDDDEVTWDGLQQYVRKRVARDVGNVVGGGARQTPALNAREWSGEPPVLVVVRDVATPRPADVGKTTRDQPPLARAPFGEQRAKELQKAWADYLGRKAEETVDLGGGVGMEFVLVPPGTFMMGSPDEEKNHSSDENQHEVTITRPFYLGKYAVTQEQYNRLLGENPSYFSAGGGGKAKVQGLDTSRFPVEEVSWEEADAFCTKLRQRTSRAMRLPSEAEWEYACRAGTTTPFSFGSELNGKQSNCDGNSPYGTTEKGPYLARTCRVDSYRPNAFGLYDMHGNVYQWCQDYYGAYDGLPAKDPARLDKSSEDARVLRGGSWIGDARRCRAARRGWGAPAGRRNLVGLRVAFRLD